MRQNRWRACRYGMEALFVDPVTLEAVPARKAAQREAVRLLPVAERLGCVWHLDRIREMATQPTGSEHQLALSLQTRDLEKAVRHLLSRSRLAPTIWDRRPRSREMQVAS